MASLSTENLEKRVHLIGTLDLPSVSFSSCTNDLTLSQMVTLISLNTASMATIGSTNQIIRRIVGNYKIIIIQKNCGTGAIPGRSATFQVSHVSFPTNLVDADRSQMAELQSVISTLVHSTWAFDEVLSDRCADQVADVGNGELMVPEGRLAHFLLA